MIRRLLPVLLIASASLLHGAVVLPKISAPNSTSTETETVFTGGARLTYDNLLLLADEIHYNPKTQVAHAIGNVSMTRGTQRMLADEMTYNLIEKTYTVKNVRAGTPPYYISGSAVEGGQESVIIHDAILTFSDPSILTPTLKADTLTYIPGKSVQTNNAQVGVGPFRPIPAPSYKQSVKDPIFSYMTAKAGFSSKMGAFVEVGLLAPVTPSVKAGGDLGIYTDRGVLIGPGMEYNFSNDIQTVRGKLTTGYINDQGDRRNDVLNNPIPADREFVSWEHYQTIGEHLSLLGEVNYWSDSYILRDFRPDEYKNVQNPDNFFEGTYTQENYVISAFTRFQPNNWEAVQQRLPEVRFDGLPIEVGAGIYHRFNASFAVLRDDEPTNAIVAGPTMTSDRLDAYYSLTRPFTPREWLSIKPVVGARFTYYDQAQAGRDNYSRMLGEIGFDAELHGNATYDYKNERWGIDGLRHEVTPYVSYRYIPEASKGQPYIPPIDRDTFTTSLQPLGLGDRRDIDTLQDTTKLRLGLDNALQTRDPHYGSRNLVDLNMATDWNLDPRGGARFSAIQTQLLVKPANWIQFDAYQNVTPDDMTLRELNTGVTFRDAKVWSLRLGTDYLKSGTYTPYAGALPQSGASIQQYTAELHYFLNEVYEAISLIAYDADKGEFTRQDYGLRQNIRNVWFINYLLAFSNGDSRASSVGFSVKIELLKF